MSETHDNIATDDSLVAARRRHPDLFTESEALAYLHKSPDDAATLKNLRRYHDLPGFKVGTETMYHRAHLDALVMRLAGMDQQAQPTTGGRRMRIGGQ